MTPKQLLVKTRALLADRNRHCRGAQARDEDGIAVEPNSPHATRWCAYGGLAHNSYGRDATGKLTLDPNYERACSYLEAAAVELCDDIALLSSGVHPAFVNDVLGHAAAIKMFDLAIELAEKDEEPQEPEPLELRGVVLHGGCVVGSFV